MRAIILLLFVLASPGVLIAQENWGKIIFKTIGIPKADGSGTYNVPLRDYNGGAGLGSLPGGATIELCLPDRTQPGGVGSSFAISAMGTSPSTSPYAANPASQTVTVPGYPPGSRAVIIVRAWTGSSPFFGLTGEWIFTTLPLGGTPTGGGPDIPTPSLTGWGTEDGSGIAVTPWPPRTFVSGPAEGAVVAAPARIHVTTGYGGDPGCTATNFALYAGSILVTNALLSAGVFPTYVTPPLGAGTYSIYSAVDAGYGSPSNFLSTGRTQSVPINITVVDPVDISLTPPAIANDQLTFQYAVNPGLTYTVLTSTDLKTWQLIETNKPTVSPALFSRATFGAPTAFYQVQRMPNP